jgi:hypothetical protein
LPEGVKLKEKIAILYNKIIYIQIYGLAQIFEASVKEYASLKNPLICADKRKRIVCLAVLGELYANKNFNLSSNLGDRSFLPR